MLPDTFDADGRASAQVIGELLLVVVTLIGAVVVGVVVFDFDDRFLGEETPTVEIRFTYDEANETLTAQHRSGRTLQGDRVAFVSDNVTLDTWGKEPNVTTGDELTIYGVPPDRTVIVYWHDENGNRHELRRWYGPAA